MIRSIAFFIAAFVLAYTNPCYKAMGQDAGERMLVHNGSEVKTTFAVDPKFIGRYKGSKEGFLLLNSDGTGVYKYDIYGFRKGKCKGGEVQFIWGFILDDKGKVLKFDRSYGYSYPVIYVSTGDTGFQDCEKKSMVDYLLVRKDGSIAVSSSDDWVKVAGD